MSLSRQSAVWKNWAEIFSTNHNAKKGIMMDKHLLCPELLRRIPEHFSWLDHRLVRDGPAASPDLAGTLPGRSSGFDVPDPSSLSLLQDPLCRTRVALSSCPLSIVSVVLPFRIRRKDMITRVLSVRNAHHHSRPILQLHAAPSGPVRVRSSPSRRGDRPRQQTGGR